MSDDLIEQVARKLAADTCGKESEWPLYMRRASAAIAIIRPAVLEEAARVAEGWVHSPPERSPGWMPIDIAAALAAWPGAATLTGDIPGVLIYLPISTAKEVGDE